METRELTARVRHQENVGIVDLAGDINRHSDGALHAAYEEAAAASGSHIVLNFSDVGFINSTGIAVIVSLLARARAAQRKLIVFGLSDHYQRIFEITRLVDFMSVVPDEASALAHTSTPED